MSGLKSKLAAFATVGIAIAGCTVGPNFKTPVPPTPSTGQFSASLPLTVGSADQPPPNWWKLYNSPALDALVGEALAHNNNLLVAAANLAEARGALSLAKAGRFPSTTLSSGASYGVTSTAAADAVLARNGAANPAGFYTAGFDASYEIDLFGRIRRAVEAARDDVDAERAAEDVTRISVAGETTRAYLNACAYADEETVARQSLSIVNQALGLTEIQEKYGVASDFDLARERELVEQTEATLPNYESQRRAALFELAVLTGRPPEEISRAADSCKTPPKLTTLLPIGDVQGLFKRRPDVREAERRLAGNVARVGIVTANLYPTISIGASVQTAASQLSGLTSLTNLSYGIGPLLNWTFPNTLVAQAQIREARAVASASYATFQQTVLQALQDTEEAVTNYDGELTRNAALRRASNQAQIAYKLAQVQYQGGVASSLDVLTAETNLVNDNQALAASDETVVSDQVTLFKALGGGWEQAPDVTPLPLQDARNSKPIVVR